MQEGTEEDSFPLPTTVQKKRRRGGSKKDASGVSPKEATMPVAPAKRRTPKQEKQEIAAINSWERLEATKANLALAMDKAEYLASSRNRLTDISALQADQMTRALRNRSEPNLYMHATLSRGVPQVVDMLDDQREMQKSGRTVWKRLNALNRYVVDQEMQRSGRMAGEKAKLSSRGLAEQTPSFPQYSDIMSARLLKSQGANQLREPPLLSVKCGMTYRPPPQALYHGFRAKDSQKSPAKSMATTLPGLR